SLRPWHRRSWGAVAGASSPTWIGDRIELTPWLPLRAPRAEYSPMAERAPRHLAEPAKRFGLSPLQQLFLVAMLGLAAITAVTALLTRDPGTGRPGAGPATTRAQAAPIPATTAPPTRPVRPTPGNLLAGGDFERDLAGWAPRGRAKLPRVGGGSSLRLA